MANFKEIDDARKILGLNEKATMKEIKGAFRSMAYKHHPDKQSDAEKNNTETMKKLNWAYTLLTDYCRAYKYSFREEDVAETYPYEEYMRNWRNKWFDSI